MSQRVLAHYAWPNDLGLTLGIHMVGEENDSQRLSSDIMHVHAHTK